VLGRWVLQDDGTRVLELVRCSEIEGHHIESRSSWAHPENRMGNHCLNVGGKVVCISVVDCFVILMYFYTHHLFQCNNLPLLLCIVLNRTVQKGYILRRWGEEMVIQIVYT